MLHLNLKDFLRDFCKKIEMFLFKTYILNSSSFVCNVYCFVLI